MRLRIGRFRRKLPGAVVCFRCRPIAIQLNAPVNIINFEEFGFRKFGCVNECRAQCRARLPNTIALISHVLNELPAMNREPRSRAERNVLATQKV